MTDQPLDTLEKVREALIRVHQDQPLRDYPAAINDILARIPEQPRDEAGLRDAVNEIAGRCERWTTPDDLGAQWANGRMGAFRDAAKWLRTALAAHPAPALPEFVRFTQDDSIPAGTVEIRARRIRSAHAMIPKIRDERAHPAPGPVEHRTVEGGRLDGLAYTAQEIVPARAHPAPSEPEVEVLRRAYEAAQRKVGALEQQLACTPDEPKRDEAALREAATFVEALGPIIDLLDLDGFDGEAECLRDLRTALAAHPAPSEPEGDDPVLADERVRERLGDHPLMSGDDGLCPHWKIRRYGSEWVCECGARCEYVPRKAKPAAPSEPEGGGV